MSCTLHSYLILPYLNDELDETEWIGVRDHLRDCQSCRAVMLAADVPSADLKRAFQKVPPAAIVADLLKYAPAPAAAVTKSKFAFKGGRLLWLIVPAGLMALGAAAVALAPSLKKAEPETLSAGLSGGAAVLQSVWQHGGASTGGDAAGKGPGLAKGVALQPLHWHLVFPTAESRSQFMNFFTSVDPDPSYRTPTFYVFSVTRANILKLIDAANHYKVKIQGSFITVAGLPDFEGKVRLSLALNLAEQPAGMTLTEHWHFSFQLANRYQLLEKLKEEGAEVVYETPELWVFDIAANRLESIQQIARNFQGLTTDFGPIVEVPAASGVKIRIAAYVAEG